MQAIANIDLLSLADTALSLLTAFVLGGLIGFERQVRQRTAGLRTNVLVAVGAALFVDIAARLYAIHGGTPTMLHVVAYVVSGVGFLGAGVIMREEGSVRGINTAATLWGSAAVGCAAGADLLLEAALGCAFVLAANTLLRPVVNRIHRQPLDTAAVEATYVVTVIAPRERRREALTLLESVFEAADYPLRNVEVQPFGPSEVEIEARLVATSIDGAELDRLIERLRESASVLQAFWSQDAST
jgi:putative Mg2+ transporter-C (MgtC) family protein